MTDPVGTFFAMVSLERATAAASVLPTAPNVSVNFISPEVEPCPVAVTSGSA